MGRHPPPVTPHNFTDTMHPEKGSRCLCRQAVLFLVFSSGLLFFEVANNEGKNNTDDKAQYGCKDEPSGLLGKDE